MLNAWCGFKSNAKMALIFRVSTALFFALIKHQFKFYKNLGHLATYEAIGFPAFLGLFAATYKFILCFLRRLTNSDDKTHAAIAGFVAALTLAFDVPRRRVLFATYLFTRALMIGTAWADSNNVVKKRKNFEVLTMGIVTGISFYAFHFEKYAYDKGAGKIFLALSRMTDLDYGLVMLKNQYGDLNLYK